MEGPLQSVGSGAAARCSARCAMAQRGTLTLIMGRRRFTRGGRGWGKMVEDLGGGWKF